VRGLSLRRRKWTPSKNASVLTTWLSPVRARSSAASSPIPSSTWREPRLRAAERAMRSISPNSPSSRSCTLGSVA
jgi:hypothetical protein